MQQAEHRSANRPLLPVILAVLIGCIALIVSICAIVRSCSLPSNASSNFAETPTPSTYVELHGEVDPSSPAVSLDENAVSLVAYTGNGLSLGDDGALTVALDPGHGAEDEGTSGFGLIESSVTWAICSYCAAYLEKIDSVDVVITRGEDENPSLEERALAAVQADADILVSLHINYNEQDARLNGAYIYYPTALTGYLYEETGVVGETVAANIMNELASLGLTDNGIVDEPLRVNPFDEEDASYTYPNDDSGFSDYYGIIRWPRYYGIAAVLVEHAFLSNNADAALLADETFLQELGEADARGILAAFGYEVVGNESDASTV